MKRTDAIVYLRRYYAPSIPAEYSQDESRADEFLDSPEGRAVVKAFQDEFGTKKADGVLEESTLRAMQTPRCGCTESMLAEARGALAQHPNRNWKASPLLYRFEKFVEGIDQTTQRDLARQGVQHWMEACGIWIREAKPSEKEDVVILSVGRGRQDNFDGSSGTLAWAYVAGFLMKFDDDENWAASGDSNGIGWLEVFDHEFGHILGIGHLSDGNLMAPFYKRGLYKPQSGDIREAQARYGKPTWTPEEPTDPTEPEPPSGGIDGLYRLTTNRPGVYVLRKQGA